MASSSPSSAGLGTKQGAAKLTKWEKKDRLGWQRLLLDYHELITKPYPKIAIFPYEDNIARACLVLHPDYYPPLHLKFLFPDNYPVAPPRVKMNSDIHHPNVYGDFICASILNYGDQYTPAYTLKGIAIQLLSFFDSETLHQDEGGQKNLTRYQEHASYIKNDLYRCIKCGFGTETGLLEYPRWEDPLSGSSARPLAFDARVERSPEKWPSIQSQAAAAHASTASDGSKQWRKAGSHKNTADEVQEKDKTDMTCHIDGLPNEVLLLILENIDDFEHLTNFIRAWPRVSDVVRAFNVIRQRELQCFCLKQGYKEAKLGVGVTVNKGQISSEFDLLSEEAYRDLEIRHSIHGLRFQHWLPLPISWHHWRRVKADAHRTLKGMSTLLKTSSAAAATGTSDARVLFTFMNDIVVKLNQVTEKISAGPSHGANYAQNLLTAYEERYERERSTLRHASEKAIESYFHLFHLLVCLAVEDPRIVEQANDLLTSFKNGKRSKRDCPNLGHLLIALLISDVPVTEELIKSIITEAITRNVVWMLDEKGANMPELSYMERDRVSKYRLDKTFLASRTSYRLLMFSELFRRTARPSSSGGSGKAQLREILNALFARHGAPPSGNNDEEEDAASRLAAEVRRLQAIDNFPAFMREMGLSAKSMPTPATFTNVLRSTIDTSMRRGYSRWAIKQGEALRLRVAKDPGISLSPAETRMLDNINGRVVNVGLYRGSGGGFNFFPLSGTNRRNGDGANRGGRGGSDSAAGRGGGRGGRSRGRGGGGRGRGGY